MCRVNRLIRTMTAAVAGMLTMSPLAAAAASPSPSPTLDTVLAAPPSGFAELTTGALHGEFDAHGWATTVTSGSDATATEATLKRDGFVDGYGKTWAQAGAGRGLVEAVMAFNGGRGARRALTAFEASTKADSSYKHPDTISGIDPYYGAHAIDPSTKAFADEFVFVKGNDVFFVAVGSQKDDALAVASSQAKAQYDSAPANTIPTADWPENAQHSVAYDLGAASANVLFIALIVGVVGLVVGLTLRGRRRSARQQFAVAGPAPAAVQMSQDGNYWWDGQTWRDASHEAPPTAQRSSDGTLWWDGRTWRPVPQPTPQPPSS